MITILGNSSVISFSLGTGMKADHLKTEIFGSEFRIFFFVVENNGFKNIFFVVVLL